VKSQSDTILELHGDSQTGTLLGNCSVSSTSNAWATQNCTLGQPVTGVARLYVVAGGAVHLNWLKFQSVGSTGTEGAGGTDGGGSGGNSSGGASGNPVDASIGASGGAAGYASGGSSGMSTGGAAGNATGSGTSAGGATSGPAGAGGGSTGTSGVSSGGGGNSGTGGSTGGGSSGCGCRIGSSGSSPGPLLIVGLAAVSFGLRRKRAGSRRGAAGRSVSSQLTSPSRSGHYPGR
jgi:MYXO-CTERM domain-containing protein